MLLKFIINSHFLKKNLENAYFGAGDTVQWLNIPGPQTQGADTRTHLTSQASLADLGPQH